MSRMHYSTPSIMAMLDGKYTRQDIQQALANLMAI